MWEHFIKYDSFKALLCSLAILAQSYLCSPAFTCNFYRWRTFEYDVFWECVMLTKILPSDLWLFPFVTSEGLCLWVLVREDGIRVHFHKDISALYIIGLQLLLTESWIFGCKGGGKYRIYCRQKRFCGRSFQVSKEHDDVLLVMVEEGD